MLIQTIIYSLVIIGIALIAFFTYYKRRDKSIMSFSMLSIAIGAWLLSQFLVQLNIRESGLFFAQLAVLSSNIIALLFLIFIIYFSQFTSWLKSKMVLFILAVPIIVISLFSFSPLILKKINITESGFAIDSIGNLYFVQLFMVGIYLFVGILILVIDTFKKPKHERTQNYYLLFALSQAVIITMIVNTVFATIPSTQILVILSLLLMLLLIAFAMIRHRLFDVKFAVVRVLTYLLSVLAIGILYGFFAFNLFTPFLARLSAQQRQLIYTALAIALAFTYAPLFKLFGKITNNIFYRDKYDAQILINSIGQIMASEINLDKLSTKVIKELCTEMKIDKGEIVVFGEKQLFYENNIFKKDGDEISQRELRKLGRTMVAYDLLQSGERKDLMSEYGISISMPLKTGDKFMGYLLLANKKSGDIYTNEDMKVLEVIGSELSVAVQNALSYKEIQLFSETLAERVRQRTAQLKSANDQLKILDQAKDEFISMASHQLRTPLTTVKGYTSMLDEGDFGKLSKEQREPVQLALDGANRMARLIDDLLNVSRMDANRFFLEVADVDMTKVVEQEITQLQSIAESKDVKLNYTPPKEKIPEIRLDENKTRQVIMNLVDNAIHYSQPPKGGGEVNVSFELDGDNVVFIVKDNGIGVPLKVQNRLFTKMFRANNAKELRPDGTGLGLYLVKRVVQDEGGKLIFESVEGKGSTFGFTLPISGVPKTVEAQSRKIGAKVAATSKS